MLEIKTLEGCTFKEIEEVFNLSFSDYYFPIRFTAQQLEQKFEREDGNLMLSVGVFDNGKLVGFILHFLSKLNGEVALYNGGTGVIPTHRGHGLTQRMWMFIQPTLKEYRVEKMILEVLTVNEPAIAIYKRIGFKLKRTLNC